MIRFEQPARVAARDGSASVQGSGKVSLSWDLSEALNRSSRLARQMENAADAQDTAQILSTCAELLRDWPLNDEKVGRAMRLIRETMQSGRQDLTQLEPTLPNNPKNASQQSHANLNEEGILLSFQSRTVERGR